MKKQVFITSENYAKNNPEALQLLKDAGIQYNLSDINRAHTADEILERAGKANAILVFNTFDQVNRKVIENLPDLEVISRHGVGVEMIDVQAAAECDVIVKNTNSPNEEDAVADFTMGLVINLARDVVRLNNTTKKGGWNRYATSDLCGSTFGIIGLGKIGKSVAERALAFKMKILAVDLTNDNEFCEKHGIKQTDMDTLLKESDFISLHVPLIEQTRHLIGKEEMKKMKPTAFIINASRGPVIDNEALISSLKFADIAGAALDVYDNEPPGDSLLLSLENVICTPHVAGITRNVIKDIDIEAASNIVNTLCN